jgi:hypothetical protein
MRLQRIESKATPARDRLHSLLANDRCWCGLDGGGKTAACVSVMSWKHKLQQIVGRPAVRHLPPKCRPTSAVIERFNRVPTCIRAGDRRFAGLRKIPPVTYSVVRRDRFVRSLARCRQYRPEYLFLRKRLFGFTSARMRATKIPFWPDRRRRSPGPHVLFSPQLDVAFDSLADSRSITGPTLVADRLPGRPSGCAGFKPRNGSYRMSTMSPRTPTLLVASLSPLASSSSASVSFITHSCRPFPRSRARRRAILPPRLLLSH